MTPPPSRLSVSGQRVADQNELSSWRCAGVTQVVPWEQLPMPMLYDGFMDTAMVLSGEYLGQEPEATFTAEAGRWWARVVGLRASMRAVDPDDREALLDHMQRWRDEAADLNP
jgi:hypothetical protein